MALSAATLTVTLAASQVGSNAFNNPTWSGTMSLVQTFAAGTGANQFDQLYMAERTIASASNDDIDLSGVLTDVFGTTITAVELVGFVVINKAADGTVNTTNLTIGVGTNPVVGYLGGTTPTIGPIHPGGVVALMNPDATGLATITPSTGDIFRIANSSGASARVQVAFMLRSA